MESGRRHTVRRHDPFASLVPRLTDLKILVGEDDADARELLRAILVDSEAVVVAAATVDEGLSAFDRHHPDLVLCDIALAERDGYDFLREARHRGGGDVPIVALTAAARDEERQRALAEGFRAHIAKPVDPLELVREVARIAGRS